MINEVIRAEELLEGVPFKKDYFSSAYMILIKYFFTQGLDALEIREKIEEWETKYQHKRYFDLNRMIMIILQSKEKSVGEIGIIISHIEFNEIKKRFDNEATRKVALSLLCLSKQQRSKEISVSLPSLCQLVNITYETIRKNIMDELIEFKFVTKVRSKQKKWGWEDNNNNSSYKRLRLNLLIDIDFDCKNGKLLIGNDIETLYRSLL